MKNRKTGLYVDEETRRILDKIPNFIKSRIIRKIIKRADAEGWIDRMIIEAIPGLAAVIASSGGQILLNSVAEEQAASGSRPDDGTTEDDDLPEREENEASMASFDTHQEAIDAQVSGL